jgi:acetolactate decarboxylase
MRFSYSLLRLLSAAAVAVILAGCCATAPQHAVSQVSTIDALLAGVYRGHVPLRQLLTMGNAGIGTFDNLDGEMIIMNGTVYQVKADGKVYLPDLNINTPFASVVNFKADKTFALPPGTDFKGLTAIVDKEAANGNLFCAIIVRGTFSKMKTRSVPAQQEPFRPLAEVTKNQPVFNLNNVSGAIIGFRLPPFVKGVNVPGYHLHFLSDDLKSGGHILDFELSGGTAEISICDKFFMLLPGNEKLFNSADLSKDRSAELNKAEK